MKRAIGVLVLVALAGVLSVAAGCSSLATPQAPSSASPSSGGTSAVAGNVSQQVKDGAQLYVAYGCIRCHAPDGVGGVPNRLNVGGDSTIPALNNLYRDPSEQFRTPVQITQVMFEGSIISKKPGVINMPSWQGVVNDGAGQRHRRLHPGGPAGHGGQLRREPRQGFGHLHRLRLHHLPRAGGRQRHAVAGAQPQDRRQGGAAAA